MFKRILLFILLCVPLLACGSGVFPTSKYNPANVTITGGSITGTAITLPYGQAMLAQDQKLSGSAGGSSVALSTRVRDLNTVVFNTIPGASLAANILTLPPGAYNLYISMPGYQTGRTRASLSNLTDGIIIFG